MKDDRLPPVIVDDENGELFKFIDQLNREGSMTVQLRGGLFRVTLTPLQISQAARKLLTEGGPVEGS